MKYLLAVALLAGTSFEMLAQEGKSERTDYASVAPIRISEPLFLVKYDTVTMEVTKPEFEDLTKHATRNVEYVTVLKDSKVLEIYGYKGRNGVVILALKSKPTFSEKFLNRK